MNIPEYVYVIILGSQSSGSNSGGMACWRTLKVSSSNFKKPVSHLGQGHLGALSIIKEPFQTARFIDMKTSLLLTALSLPIFERQRAAFYEVVFVKLQYKATREPTRSMDRFRHFGNWQSDETSRFHLLFTILAYLRWRLPGSLGQSCTRTAFYPCW